MNIASCGLGTNSVAGIIHAINNGIVFDEILFANTGRGKKYGERQLTYDYIKIFNSWLVKKGQKEIKIVFSKNKEGKAISLYEENFKLNTLPPIVFGFKTCSQRFKAAPQEKYISKLPLVKELWANGQKVTKWIFYDAGESHRGKPYSDEFYNVRYYLIENDLDREDCEQIIINEDLPLPGKSSCFYCPSMKPFEIIELYNTEREKFYEAVSLERNAKDKMTDIKGLGRDFSWWDLIKAYRYLEMIKKSNTANLILESSMKKLMKKINYSKKKTIKTKQSAIQISCELFPTNIETPCGCYDN